jgi:four helix bundle protein
MKESGVRSQESGGTGKTRSAARSFTDLIVWRKAHAFVLNVYRLTGQFPSTEVYGLTSQLRRAAVSIPANIAEGFRKASRPDKIRFMNFAQGSLEECRYYLILVNDLEYANTRALTGQLEEVSKLLDSYSKAIEAKRGDLA